MESNPAINFVGLTVLFIAIAVGSHMGVQVVLADRSGEGLEPSGQLQANDTAVAIVSGDHNGATSRLEHAELLIIFIGASACSFSHPANVRTILESITQTVHEESQRREQNVAAVGVSTDRVPSDGIAYLQEVAAFDVMIAGRAWRDEEVATGISEHVQQSVATPTVMVLERVHVTSASDERTEPAFVLRMHATGLFDLQRWVAAGPFLPPASGR